MSVKTKARRAKRRKRRVDLSVLSDLEPLLGDCEAAMTAASQSLWDINRDLAIELNRRAGRCRQMIAQIRPIPKS